MRRPRLLSLTVGAALALATAALIPTARAEDPDRSRWLVGRTYEKGPSFTTADGKPVEFYVASQEGPAGEAESAWFRFLVLENGEVAEAYAVDVTRTADQPTRLDLRWEDEGPETAGVRVAAALAAEDALWLEAARRTLTIALTVGPAWREASARLSQAAAVPEPAARHPSARSAYRALERLYAATPEHLGVLADLLAADQLLVPLEVGSDRGANLAFAWREHVGAALAAARSLDDVGPPLRTAVVCALAEGCYAHAALALAARPEREDPEDEALRAGLVRLGQEAQENLGTVAVDGPKGALRLTTVRCAAEPVGGGLLFYRTTYFTSTPSRSAETTPVWYSLTCERTDARTRWSLYGWVGGSRRLLRLYGPEEPDGEAVNGEVLRLAQAAVGAEVPK
jgi:hypothetical protein